MKRFLAIVCMMFLLSACAYADQADDLIATLGESDRAAVSSALGTANLTHRDGKPYNIKLRSKDGVTEYSFSEEEYAKLQAWLNGEYTTPQDGTDDVSALSDLELTSRWRNDNGYDFPIYGSTSADLSPISDYLTLLQENKIYIELPDLVISHDHKEYEWIYSQISDPDFYLTYVSYNDKSMYKLSLQVPISYRLQYEAMAFLMVSVLDISYDEADETLHALQLNVINHSSGIETDDYVLDYYENAQIGGFLALTVTKFAK